MSPEPSAASLEHRRFLADADVLAELGLDLAELADPDVRGYALRMEHPEIDQALRDGRDEVELDGQRVNPRLHLAMHEVVANQLWNDDPPEVWETAQRLLARGYERHEILHMLASAMSAQIWSALHEQQPYDHADHVAALNALPGSWERQRVRSRALPRRRRTRRR